MFYPTRLHLLECVWVFLFQREPLLLDFLRPFCSPLLNFFAKTPF